MAWAAVGEDRNELHLRKMRLIFSSLSLLSKIQIMVDALFENSLDVFLFVFFKYLCTTRVLSSNLRQF